MTTLVAGCLRLFADSIEPQLDPARQTRDPV